LSSETFAYMHVKSKAQGVFVDDKTKAGAAKSLCLAVRFRGDVPHDVRKGGFAVTEHEPITVVRDWSASTVQFLTSFWANEVLDEVKFDFVRPDDAGKEQTFATLTLTQVTVAFVELRSGNTAELVEAAPRTLEYIGLRAQGIEFNVDSPSGGVTANYSRQASGS
jgi:type VI protein secretion system component Hcp